MRRLLPLLVTALVACAAPDEEVASEDAALAELRATLGFDGAIERLDTPTLARIESDVQARRSRGEPEAAIEMAVERRVLVEGSQRAVGGTRPASVGWPSYDADLFQLNERERALCKSAKLVCVSVLLAAAKARVAAKVAYSDGDVGGRIDAFRHTYWNALMASSVGAAHAKAWGDAHEAGNPFDKGTKSDARLAEMDYFNNDRGRRLAVVIGDPVLLVAIALERGELRGIRYDRGDPDGVLVPTTECSDARCGR
jgi:hypothetical protein